MRKILACSLALLFVFVLSCKKDKDNNCAATSETITGSYKLTSFKVSGVEIISQFDDCERDDILTLSANNTYTLFDAGVTCDGDANGTWELNSTSTPTPSPTPTTHWYAYAHSISYSRALSHSHASRQDASEPEADCRY